MLNRKFITEAQVAVLGICILLGLVISSIIVVNGLMSFKKYSGEVITVTGSASKDIVSDLATWQCNFSRRGETMKDAYTQLKTDLEAVKAYLIANKFNEKDIQVSQIYTDTNYTKDSNGNNTNQIESYTLTQNIEVRSNDVERIGSISRSSTELINQGIQLVSEAPQYFYTKLDSLKVEMLGKATQNAKERAGNMAQSTGNRIGLMRSAQMGVFQITATNSTDVSDYGISDTESLNKKVTAVVNVTFAVK